MSRYSPIHRTLGDAFRELPAEVQCVHDNDGYVKLEGLSDVQRGGGLIGSLICWMVGLPHAGEGQKTLIEFVLDDRGISHWARNFDGRTYYSHLREGKGRHDGMLVEQLSMWTGIFALEARPDRIVWTLSELRVLGIKLPRWLSLECYAYESVRDGRYHFDIHMNIPWLGHLISYQGDLDVVASGATPPVDGNAPSQTEITAGIW